MPHACGRIKGDDTKHLAEADREREQRGAAEPGEAEGGHSRAWRIVRQRRDEREGDREQERQAMVSPYWLLVRS